MLRKETIETIKYVLSQKLYLLEVEKEKIVYETYAAMKQVVEATLQEFEKEYP